MIDKALIIIIAMYAVGFGIYGIQLTLATEYGITMVSPVTGEPIQTALGGYIQEDEFNERTERIRNAAYTTNSTYFDKVETFTTAAAFIAWELVELMAGVYIFHIMYMMGVPFPFVALAITLYVLLLARAIIGYIRGI